MKLIKIDPTAQTVELVECRGELDDMYQLIGCMLIDVCARQDNGDALVVDDGALALDPQPAAFSFLDYGQPIHGIALLTGSNEEGETVEPVMTLEQATAAVNWLGNIYIESTLEILFF